MSDLIPFEQRFIGSSNVNTVNARDLHEFLGVKTQYTHWIDRRIKTYGFVEDVDFTVAKSGYGTHSASDYFVSFDMAKELSMVERTKKGKEARQYFLECERRSQQLPQLHDPALQAIIHLTVDLDATKHKLQQVETQVARVLEEQAWMTIHQYVTLHKLEPQMPQSVQQAYATFLIGYCAQENYRVYPQPVAYQRWANENTYYVGAINATLPGWLKRHNGQITLDIVPKKGAS